MRACNLTHPIWDSHKHILTHTIPLYVLLYKKDSVHIVTYTHYLEVDEYYEINSANSSTVTSF